MLVHGKLLYKHEFLLWTSETSAQHDHRCPGWRRGGEMGPCSTVQVASLSSPVTRRPRSESWTLNPAVLSLQTLENHSGALWDSPRRLPSQIWTCHLLGGRGWRRGHREALALRKRLEVTRAKSSCGRCVLASQDPAVDKGKQWPHMLS